MAQHTYEDGTVYHTCDHCGCKLMDHEIGNTGVSITIRNGQRIDFEWWSKGEYCYMCSDLLSKAIYRTILVPERCDAKFRDDEIAKAIEEALIQREDVIEVD